MNTPNKGTPTLLKVGSKTDPSRLAGAITGQIREQGRCEGQAIGAGAVNQAVKAVAIARGYFAPAGEDICILPAFLDQIIDGEEKTVIRFVVERFTR